ncbi:folate-sensitive fragile site protein Fra10Ac1-domain-containing protein, partial [Thamnocephalis sphaerospora]
YARHLKYVRDYQLVYGKKAEYDAAAAPIRTELDVLRENHQFVRDLDEDPQALSWEQRVAKKYYDQLFKEYCLADLRFYREGKVAMRWRTEAEVVSGKGQFACGSLHCDARDDLRSWEVNFAYAEAGEHKNALVKLRLCPPCSDQLNYRKR